jgi:hypothetical protein
LDIEANENVHEPTMATFKETAVGVPVRAVRLEIDGAWRWCAVVGWSGSGPVPALLTPIEESGDGPARLLHGGEHGLRLSLLADAAGSAEAIAWSLDDGAQWGEAFCICRPETQFY